MFWRLAETVEKGPPLAGFCVSAQIDPGLRSQKCGDFDPWSPVPKFAFLARFPIAHLSLSKIDTRWLFQENRAILLLMLGLQGRSLPDLIARKGNSPNAPRK
jgi:hypothetical protein